jgi:mannose-1-phosphate guanylyltransferase
MSTPETLRDRRATESIGVGSSVVEAFAEKPKRQQAEQLLSRGAHAS